MQEDLENIIREKEIPNCESYNNFLVIHMYSG